MIKTIESRRVFAWATYDWANSTFSTTILAGFFPLFFQQYWSAGADSALTTARLGTLISISSLILALLSPFLGALTDLRAHKKRFLFFFMLIGVTCSAGLAWVPQGGWWWAGVLMGVASIGFNASCTFYDSLLPSIAPGPQADFASSLGYSLGYLGGGVLFTFNVLMYLNPSWFGLANGVEAVQWSFITVALWWLVFSIPLLFFVPEPPISDVALSWGQALRGSSQQILGCLQHLRKDRNLLLFILAFWLYIDGVYTVMNMAVNLGLALKFEPSTLISALLLVQFVGFPFALLFGKLAQKWGTRGPILFCLFVYALVVIGSSLMKETWHFFVLAILIGMVQGGVQALSRSLFSRMIPADRSGEFFGFFNLIGKFASILGPLLIGWSTYFLQDHRLGLLSLLVLFLAGGLLLWQVQEPGPS